MSKIKAKVVKSGNSQAISLNKYALTQAGLEIGDELEYEINQNQIIFTKKDNSIKDDIINFYKDGGYYKEAEVDYGNDAGNEKW